MARLYGVFSALNRGVILLRSEGGWRGGLESRKTLFHLHVKQINLILGISIHLSGQGDSQFSVLNVPKGSVVLSQSFKEGVCKK